MARKRSMFEKLGNDIIRGFGLKTGREISIIVERKIMSKTLNPNSRLRKTIDKFKLTGRFNSDLAKLLSLIDLFDEEYSTTEANFQHGVYIKSDVVFIEGKMEFMENMIINEDDEEAYRRLLMVWVRYKNKHTGNE